MQLNVLNDLAEAMKALDGKKIANVIDRYRNRVKKPSNFTFPHDCIETLLPLVGPPCPSRLLPKFSAQKEDES